MSSTIHPFVPVTLDGKERHLCFGAAAFIEFSELRGEDLLKFVRKLADKFAGMPVKMLPDGTQSADMDHVEFPFKDFNDLLWAALIHEDPDLTQREVSRMWMLSDLPALLPKVMEAFKLSMPNSTPQKAPTTISTRSRKSIGA